MFTNTLLTFHLGDRIGEGGEAAVYKAVDTQLNADIVIKKIPKTRFKGDINKYFEESQKLYLSSHHNVVKIIYGCQDDEFIYLAMPLYAKGSLKSIYDDRFLTCREIIRYSLQFLSGLNYIHSKQLLHYDIKPENILIDDTNKASISDFGLAQYLGMYGFATVEGTTPAFAPPEYFKQTEHNIKFDIYQSGLTLFRLCNGDEIFFQQLDDASYNSKGTTSFDNLIASIDREKFPNRNYFLPHIPKSLIRVIKKAIKANPDDRYDSIIDILNDLSRIEDGNDWKYTKNDNIESWSQLNRSVTCTFNITNNKYTILALKNNKRKTLYCATLNDYKEAYNLLYNCLNTNW